MTLLKRAARPLSRDSGGFRDDRLFIVACDDSYAPKQYFGFFRLPRIQIHVVPTEDGDSAAERVLERLLSVDRLDDDELWLVLDVDHYATGPHLASFTRALQRAKQNGVSVALSKPCFELWLLLHHIDDTALPALPEASDVEAALKATLGGYNKTRLRAEHYQLESVVDAISRAARLDSGVGGGDIPNANTTRMYKLWKSIIASALPSQLPSEFQRVAP